MDDQAPPLPTTDELVSQYYGGQLPSTDDLIQQHTPISARIGHVMDAFKQGFSQSTQDYQNLAPDTHKFLEDYDKNHDTITKGINEGVVLPAASYLDATMRTVMGAFSGTGAALQQVEKEENLSATNKTPLGKLAETISPIHALATAAGAAGELIESIPQGGLIGTHVPEARVGKGISAPFTQEDFTKAKSLGVPDGEGVYFGTKTPTPEQAVAQEHAATQLPEEPAQPIRPIEQQRQAIASDVSQQLQTAGRPPDEAEAAAQLVTAHYEARAERFGGELGDAQEMYERDSANIKAGRNVPVKILSQEIPSEVSSAEESGRPFSQISPSESPVTQEPLRQASERSPPSGVFTTRPIAPSTLEGEVSNSGLSDIGKSYHNVTDLQDLKRLSSESEPDLHNLLKNITENTDGAELSGVRVKDSKSLDAKLDRMQPNEISDYLGGRIIVDNRAAADDVLSHLGQYAKITHIDDFLNDEGRRDGYRAIHVQIEGNNGISAEVQIQPRALAEVGLEGHKLYKQWKGLTQTDDLDKVSELKKQVKDLYDNAWDKFNGELEQASRGKIRLATDDAKATITLMKNADASTFIHETGHHWLDEMMKDAEHDLAPDDLKNDASTVRKWLGAGEDENITRKQHEQFARGFERYMMEGIAPSRGLARVFQQFRNWLTKIYETVTKLRAPINNDIRAVFDRLLSSNPEKIIPGEEMANLHERDTIETPPEHAEAVADNIRAEVDETAKAHDPEVANALKSAENAANESTPNGAEPTGAATAGQPTPQEPQPVNAGGGPTAGEGAAGGSEAGAGSGSTKPRSGEPPASPNAKFGKGESHLVDKAGNIRLDNLNTPEDVNQVLRETAKENDNFMDARRGVISVGQQLDLADALGMDPAFINMRKIGQAFNAEQIIAARKLLIQSATSVRDSMAKAADGTDQDVMAYAEAKARHRMIQEQVSGITAEAGRALGAFRKLEGSAEAQQIGDFLKQATGQDLFQLKEEAKFGAQLETSQQISKFINDTARTKLKSVILEYYINALISGPVTHLRYSVGNALNALWTPLVETPSAAVIGAMKGTTDRVYMGEVGAQLHGLLKGSQDGARAAAQAFKTGVSPLLPSERASANFADIKVNAIPGKIGEIINLPSKSVAAIHSFFKAIRYEQNIQALAYRTAMQEGLSEGSNAFTNRIAQLSTGPTEDMMEKATANSLKELYMSPTDYHSAMGALTRFTNQSLMAKIIVPFMKIGSQITRNAFIERTPLGLFSPKIQATLAEGGAEADFQMAKMAAGVSLMGGTALLVSQGLATGDGPSDPSKRAIWLLNHRPNSFQVGDITVPYQGLGHLGMLMRFSANMTETAQAWDEEDGGKLAISFLEGITRSVLDENFMRGLKDMLDAVYHPEEYGANYIRQFATNWLPFSVGLSQVAKLTDPLQRQANNITDAAWAKIPFESEGLFPRRDRFGEAIPNGAPLPNYAADPVVQRMEALQIGMGELEKEIRGVPLTDQQYDDFSRIAGRMAKMRLNGVVANEGFSQLPQVSQIEAIHKTIEQSREAARSIIMMQNPSIMQQATQAKINALKNSQSGGQIH